MKLAFVAELLTVKLPLIIEPTVGFKLTLISVSDDRERR